MNTDILTSRAQVPLDSPARTLHRLCKHFSHKVSARWDEARGEVDFGIGQCELRAEGPLLHCLCRSQAPVDLRDIEDTIERHLGPMSGQAKNPPAVRWER
ncbi:DUF2218 domain-containing protein [Marinimicrobium locisalis]|uniref:DUF2218 domain-containing protein n=1 Tax=Marinimicrobium locisalis TaxID=546022 RepID=UPI003221E66D